MFSENWFFFSVFIRSVIGVLEMEWRIWIFIRLKNGICAHVEKMKGRDYCVFTEEYFYSWHCSGERREEMPQWEEQWLPHYQETGRSRTHDGVCLCSCGSLIHCCCSHSQKTSMEKGRYAWQILLVVSMLNGNARRLLSTSVDLKCCQLLWPLC